MASLMYLQNLIVGNYRTDIIVFAGGGGKRKQTVQTRYLICINLNGRNKFAQRLHQLRIKLRFQHQNLVLSAEYFLFILFQFLRNVTFGIDQGLLADPLLRHFILVHIAHFDIIAKDIIIPYLQTGNTRQFTFTLLHLQEIILAGIGYLAQLVQLGIHARFYHAAFINKQRRVVVDLLVNAVANGPADIQLFADVVQTGIICIHTGFLDRFNSLQCHLQGNHFARRNAPYGYFGNDAFQISYQMQLFFDQLLEVGFAEEVFHYVQPFVNGLYVFQGKHHPALQQTGSHRADSPVYHIQQTAAAVVHAAHQFEAAHRKLIQTDVLVFLYAGQRSDVPYLGMLRHNEILQDSSRSNDAILEMFHPKSFQVLDFEVFQQFLAGGGLRKHPVVQLERKEFAAEIAFKHSPAATLKKHFFRGKIIQQLIDVIERSFRCQELTGGNIQE